MNRRDFLQLAGAALVAAPLAKPAPATTSTVADAPHQSIAPDSSIECPMDVYFGWSSCYAVTVYADELDSAAMWRRALEIEEEFKP